ncbi:MAG TPA: glycosyltransferase [Syntrophobacteraceae bacterium]|nr:glycosyltransferase [Syntrophobacteraceae bacterium]
MNPISFDITIIIPVKDEAENVEPLAEELTQVMACRDWSWECLWVDDGSTDRTLVRLQALAQSDSRHRYLSFDRNVGQSAALWAGFSAARGAILATMDGDGQNDPADIPRLADAVRQGGTDMANGYRQKRKDALIRRISSRVANRFRTWMTGKSVRDVGCSTRAFRRECVAALPQFAGMHRFLPTLVMLQGFRLSELPVNHRPRLQGSSKYTIGNRLWVGLADTLGVWWLRKRAFRFRIKAQSDG